MFFIYVCKGQHFNIFVSHFSELSFTRKLSFLNQPVEKQHELKHYCNIFFMTLITFTLTLVTLIIQFLILSGFCWSSESIAQSSICNG